MATLPVLWRAASIGPKFHARGRFTRRPAEVVTASGYWQSKFGAEPKIIGCSITVDAKPREIIGVFPSSFHLGNRDASILLPFHFDRNKLMLGNFSQAVARLKPGVTIAQASPISRG